MNLREIRMLPVLAVGGVTVSTFPILLLLALVTGARLGTRQAIFVGASPSLVWSLLPWAAVSGLAGAQLYSILLALWHGASLVTAVSARGQVFYGGLLLGTGVTAWRFRQSGLPMAWLFDYGAPCVALAHAVGRIGCLLAGDDYGYATTLPWAIAFPHGAPPSTAGYLRSTGDRIGLSVADSTVMAVHPVQVYEALMLLLIGTWLWRASRRPHRAYTVAARYAVAYGAWRFVIEFLRPKTDHLAFGWTTAQLISVLCVCAGAFALLDATRRAAGPRRLAV